MTSFDAVGPLEAAYVAVMLVVLSFMAFVCQRKTWLLLGMAMNLVLGVAYTAVPGYVLQFMVA